MLTKDVALRLAEDWIQAWNAHDLDRIMAHYDDDVEWVPPVAVERLGISDGKVKGKAGLRAYFQKGLEAYPALRFTLIEVLVVRQSVVLYYENHKGTHPGEYMEVSAVGKVSCVVANYSG
jgi:ketosteroid isomerase-like protein